MRKESNRNARLRDISNFFHSCPKSSYEEVVLRERGDEILYFQILRQKFSLV
jgi:hypothetical protein